MNDTLTRENTEVPAYVARLGLEREPFTAQVEDDFFCADSALAQRLDLLQHLAEFGEPLLLVTGPQGVGKTALLQQLLLRAGPHWRARRIEAHALLDAGTLQNQCARLFGLEEPRADAGLVPLARQLAAMRAEGLLPVLLVDDAHELSSGALALIWQLHQLTAGADDRLLRIVLFGETPLIARLQEMAGDQQDALHLSALQHYTELQTAAYLQHRLATAGLTGASPLSAAQVKRIHKEAQGLPGRINARAHAMLVASESRHLPLSESREEQRAPIWSPRMLALGGAALAAVVVALVWRPEADLTGQAELLELELPEPPAAGPPPAGPATGTGALATPTASPTPMPAPPAATLKPGLPPPTPPVAEVEASQEVSPRGVIGQSSLPPPELAAEPVEPDPQQVTMLPVDEAPPAVATPPAVAEPPPAPQRLAKAEPAAAVAAPTAGAGLDWLRAAKGSHFTLQLASTQRETEAAALVKRHGLKGAHAWYPAERAGGRRYVLVYGDYPTRSAAQAALAKLPEALRAAKPWPRGIAQVQAELR